MKITQGEIEQQQTILNIELEEEDLPKYIKWGYKRLVKRTNIPGFRKGKAPLSIVKQYLGQYSILREAIDYMIPDITEQAISSQNLEISGRPKVEIVEMEPVTVKATVPLTPNVDLGSYKNIRVKETPPKITKEDVEKNIEKLRSDSSTWEPVERTVKLGDMVTMDVSGTVENRTIIDEKGAVYVPEKENLLPFPGFAEHLNGTEVGKPKDFKLTISEDYSDNTLAGKEVSFNTLIEDVKERKLPKLDDEFAKGVGEQGHENLSELRKNVEANLKEEAQKAYSEQYKESVLDELVKVSTVEMPPLLIQNEVEQMVSRRDQFVSRMNMTVEDYLKYTGKTEEEITNEMQEHALDRLSRSYTLACLAEIEGLEISSSEIDENIQSMIDKREEQEKVPNNQEVNSEDFRSAVRETLLVSKSLDRLIEIAREKKAVRKKQQKKQPVNKEART